jgi:hypothetical protein
LAIVSADVVVVSVEVKQLPAPGHPFCQQNVNGPPPPVAVAVNVAVPPTQILCGVGVMVQTGGAAIVTLCCGEADTCNVQLPWVLGNRLNPFAYWNVNVAPPAAISAGVKV